MRRSQAPSLRNSSKPSLPNKGNDPPPLRPGNADGAVRSTDNILSLLLNSSSSSNIENIEITQKTEKPALTGQDLDFQGDTQSSDVSCSENVYSNDSVVLENSLFKTFNVVYAKQSMRKHKIWEGDGTLEIGTKIVTLKDESGKILGKTSVPKSELVEGSRLVVAGKEVELIDLADQKSVKAPPSSCTKKPFTALRTSVNSYKPTRKLNCYEPKQKLLQEPYLCNSPTPETIMKAGDVPGGLRSTDNILNLLSESSAKFNIENNTETSAVHFQSDTQNSDGSNLENFYANDSVIPETSTSKTFNVVYAKQSTRKHKIWEGDGTLEIGNKILTLRDKNGKIIGTTSVPKTELVEGSRLVVSGKEVELIDLADQKLVEPPSLSDSSKCFTAPNTIPNFYGSNDVPETDNDVVSVRSTNDLLNLLSESSSNEIADEADEDFTVLELDLKNEGWTSNVPNLEKICSDNDNRVLDNSEIKVFKVVYGKQSRKKHKTWNGDGTLEISSKTVTLKNEKGKVVGATSLPKSKLEEGSRLLIGSKEVEIIGLAEQKTSTEAVKKSGADEQPIKRRKLGPVGRKFTIPTLGASGGGLVLPEPTPQHRWFFNKENLPVTPVCVERSLAKKLRQHQEIGVTFLYECIMGFKENNMTGAILADEMGLGKTLQCIALIWTLLKQGPYGNRPVVKKVLIVTPSSLTMNWHNEFLKWLGREKLVPFAVNQKNKPTDFKSSVMIISYEMFVKYYEDVKKHNFNLLICDEGHRLKNSNIRVSQLLNSLDCDRRILLTGTPIQNDLQEFYALVDFVNPNILGSPSEFRRRFEEPILAARQPDADEDVLAKGEESSQELNRKTSLFLLRRTKEVLDKYLPAKHEIVVFCKPTEIQKKVYNETIDLLLDTKENCREFGFSDGVAHFSAIATLKKICNHPGLVRKDDSDLVSQGNIMSQVLTIFPDLGIVMSTEDSSKLTLVIDCLRELKETSPKERVVIVSNSTQTLDMISEALDSVRYTWCRLDGATPASQRSGIVDRFNTSSNIFVFLLSAKAGGVGLNLTGASRLFLFDSDWNPATDLQAMSRIWRDGQKHSVYIYRLLTSGTIEEKIYQRQISKQGLCDGIVDPLSARSIKLSQQELKEIFSRCENLTDCSTHEMLSCDCSKRGEIPVVDEVEERSCQLTVKQKSSLLKMNELLHWEHHGRPFDPDLLAQIRLATSQDIITFIFKNCST